MRENTVQRPKDDFAQVDFGDKRLNDRLSKVIESGTKNAEKSILGSSGARGEAKAFYRLLGNEKFDMKQLQDHACEATFSRMHGTVLMIQDTSDIDLNGHKKTEGLGYCSEHIRGIKLHSCIAVSPEGLPFGLVRQFYETRQEAKSPLTQKEKAARPIEEKESFRWIDMLREATRAKPDGVHLITVCDREGDFYELYAEALRLCEDFIIRVMHDRQSDESEKVATKIRRTGAIAKVTVKIPRDSRGGGKARETEMEVAHCRVNIIKPASVRTEGVASKLSINLVRITEIAPPQGKEAIEWILATSLPINNELDALTIVEHYIQRWKIERFHFVLKSGCNAKKIQQRTFERIKPVLLIYSVIAMFIMAVTYAGRVTPQTLCDTFMEDNEWKTLYRVVHKTRLAPNEPYTMADVVRYLGQLSGYKRAPSDGPPGLEAIWNGLFALFFAIDLLMGQV